MKNFFALLCVAASSAAAQISPAIVANLHARAASGPPPPDLVFSDFHYSSNFPSNDTTVARATNGTQTLIYWDTESIFITEETTFDIYFIVQGTATFVTNWLDTVSGVGADPGTLTVDLDGHTTGYGTGSNPINSSVGLTGFGDGSTYDVDAGSITPIVKLWMHAQLQLFPPSVNDFMTVTRLTIAFNNP